MHNITVEFYCKLPLQKNQIAGLALPAEAILVCPVEKDINFETIPRVGEGIMLGNADLRTVEKVVIDPDSIIGPVILVMKMPERLDDLPDWADLEEEGWSIPC